MALSFECAYCGHNLLTCFLTVGEPAKCPRCGEMTEVPPSAEFVKVPSSILPVSAPDGTISRKTRLPRVEEKWPSLENGLWNRRVGCTVCAISVFVILFVVFEGCAYIGSRWGEEGFLNAGSLIFVGAALIGLLVGLFKHFRGTKEVTAYRLRKKYLDLLGPPGN